MPYILNTPDMQADPYPTYAAMRAQPGMVWAQTSPRSAPRRFFTRYEEVVAILKDPRFINDSRRLPGAEDWTRKWYIPSSFRHFGNSLPLVDNPDHARLRRLVHKVFTPGMVGEMAGGIRAWSERALDACADKPVIDLLAEYALPVPLNAISDLVGVAIPDRLRFRRWMSNNVSDFSSDNALQTAMKFINTFQLDAFLNRLIAERRAEPRADLTSALVAVEDDGETLSPAELIAMLFIILFAGHETTVNLIASGTLALLQHPDQFAALKADMSLLDGAIEELLRYTNPVQHIAPRYASIPLEVAGEVIGQSEVVMLGVAAANRDETVFPDGEKLDIRRAPNRHIAFGFGLHYCLGAPLARLEAQIAFTTLFERYPDLQLAVPAETLRWRGAPALRGLRALPIRLMPAR